MSDSILRYQLKLAKHHVESLGRWLGPGTMMAPVYRNIHDALNALVAAFEHHLSLYHREAGKERGRKMSRKWTRIEDMYFLQCMSEERIVDALANHCTPKEAIEMLTETVIELIKKIDKLSVQTFLDEKKEG